MKLMLYSNATVRVPIEILDFLYPLSAPIFAMTISHENCQRHVKINQAICTLNQRS